MRRQRDKFCPKPKAGWDELARDNTILQSGDVIHVQNWGILSKLIRLFSRAWKEEPSWASHTAMVLRVGEEIEIIEALWRTVVRPITAYRGKKSMLLVCRKPGSIEEEQKQKMIEKAEYYKGKQYGYSKIAFHYKEDDFRLYINGLYVDSDNSGVTLSSGTIDEIDFSNGLGSNPFYGRVKRLSVYDSALTDSQLESLTGFGSFSEMKEYLNYA